MARGRLRLDCSLSFRIAKVVAIAQLFSVASKVHCRTTESVFCDTFAIPFGYQCRQYTTQTTDGYLLVAHRIRNPPRTASPQPRSHSSTAGAIATSVLPLCVSTAEQPFETIHDYLRDSDHPEQSSKTTGLRCYPMAAPVPSTGAVEVDHDGNAQFEGKTVAERLEPDRVSAAASQAAVTSEEVASQTGQREGQGEGVEEELPRLDGDHQATLNSHIATAPAIAIAPAIAEAIASTATATNSEPHPEDSGSAMGSGQTFPPLAASRADLIHSSMTHRRRKPSLVSKSSSSSSPFPKRRIGNSYNYRNTVTTALSNSTTTLSASPVAATAEQRTHSVSTDAAAPLPEPRPVPTKTPVSQAPPPPPSSERVSAPEGGEPVLLMHQEFQNGDSWFVNMDDGSDQLLPFLLLNSGFDVWIGHLRATYYGHDHATLTPYSQSYWNWSWDEYAKYDMPALLELVHTESGSTVHFVGVSQSATSGAAAATMPLPASLLRSLTLIGPTVFRGNTTSETLTAWASFLVGNMDMTYYDPEFQNGVFNLTGDLVTQAISSVDPLDPALTDISGPNCCRGSFAVKFDNGWDGTTSRKNMLHYQQGIRTNTWSHFDYGSAANNSIAYDGMPLPPTYDPEDIPPTLPVLVIYGGQDKTAPPGGSREFLFRLRNSSSSISAVSLTAYAHFDLFYSLNRTQDVFIPVLQFLEKQRPLL